MAQQLLKGGVLVASITFSIFAIALGFALWWLGRERALLRDALERAEADAATARAELAALRDRAQGHDRHST